MSDEIKEIKFIKYNGIEGYIELMKHDVEPLNNLDCKSIELYYDGKDIKALLDYIINLQQKVEQYENPDDLTLFYMWLDEKAKDKMKYLQQENEKLKEENKRWEENHKAVCIQRDNILDNIVKDTEKRIDYKSRCEKAIPKLKELSIKIKDILKIEIDIKEISDIEELLQGGKD